MTELKKCPFCGGNPEAYVTVDKWVEKNEAKVIAIIYCSKCRTNKEVYFNFKAFKTPINIFTEAFAEVERLWNMRAEESN